MIFPTDSSRNFTHTIDMSSFLLFSVVMSNTYPRAPLQIPSSLYNFFFEFEVIMIGAPFFKCRIVGNWPVVVYGTESLTVGASVEDEVSFAVDE